MSLRLIWAALCLCLLAGAASAQPHTLSGTVTDPGGNPIPFVTVTEKGTRNAVTADVNGVFTIRVARLPDTLHFSAAGYLEQALPVHEKSAGKAVKAVLGRSGSEGLSEVVVTALGTARHAKELGYSTARVRGADLSGKVSGLSVDGRATPRKGEILVKRSGRTDGAFPAPSGKQLTAGELNDFKKWKLWSDYEEADFQTTSGRWGLRFRQRYCAQLQHAGRGPAVGVPVYLLHPDTRDTVWRAVTDNTGKAELWADAGGADGSVAYTIACAGAERRKALPFHLGVNQLAVPGGCAVPDVVDVAFVVDATGSMGDEIAYLQAELKEVISGARALQGPVRLRVGSVFYRDHTDAYLTRHHDFDEDPAALLRFVGAQSAGGGGDFPEAVDDALATALDSLQWSPAARSRLLFLVLDAPPHDAARGRMDTLTRRAAALGVRIIPVVCSGIDKPTEYLMRCLALATNGNYVFLTDDSGIGGKHLKPTTDEFRVELLAHLMQRLIAEAGYVAPCDPAAPAAVPVAIADSGSVQLYPNPTHDVAHLVTSAGVRELFVTDFTGKVLQRLTAGGKTRRWRIQLGAYPSGTYLLRYFVADEGWRTARVVLVR
ncbi:carboxypeptidase regulatory-like domain-containing protein [Flaviaesturariibacter amylovorans]|uniref:VWFA domain-containing protein n=1 Tax=Flaviaesturariibacter amylovorans TaxID=1084520 RepID=A0ABP8HRN7_9BACT